MPPAQKCLDCGAVPVIDTAYSVHHAPDLVEPLAMLAGKRLSRSACPPERRFRDHGSNHTFRSQQFGKSAGRREHPLGTRASSPRGRTGCPPSQFVPCKSTSKRRAIHFDIHPLRIGELVAQVCVQKAGDHAVEPVRNRRKRPMRRMTSPERISGADLGLPKRSE